MINSMDTNTAVGGNSKSRKWKLLHGSFTQVAEYSVEVPLILEVRVPEAIFCIRRDL